MQPNKPLSVGRLLKTSGKHLNINAYMKHEERTTIQG